MVDLIAKMKAVFVDPVPISIADFIKNNRQHGGACGLFFTVKYRTP